MAVSPEHQELLEEISHRTESSNTTLDCLHMNPPSRTDNRFESKIPNTLLAISAISFCLGSVFSWGLNVAFSSEEPFWWTTYRLGFFVAAWAAFHFGEFATTAGWNRDKCSVDSFLLQNGTTYHIANGTALFEYMVTLYFKPSWKSFPVVSGVGIIMVIFFQALRSAAMITASTNFNHSVQFKKAETHELVTKGVYSWSRHPSYTGFFYWALGTQLVLQNPVTFVIYFVLLWKFFSSRILDEERALVRFFGDDYVQYRKRVGTWIPLIR